MARTFLIFFAVVCLCHVETKSTQRPTTMRLNPPDCVVRQNGESSNVNDNPRFQSSEIVEYNDDDDDEMITKKEDGDDNEDDDDDNDDDKRSPAECNLRTYDADKELHLIREWYEMVKNPIDESTAMTQLARESCVNDALDEDDAYVMCSTYIESKQRKRMADQSIPHGLNPAEALSVTMYTAEYGGFYRIYNNASANGIFAPYRVFTSLLLSAVKKLAVIEPVRPDEVLYRGMRVKCKPPEGSRIIWKHFTSTSLSRRVASYFGTDTSLVFSTPATFVGARISNLSAMGDFEEEVLISPFVVFDVVKVEDQTFYFNASSVQELLAYNAARSLGSALVSFITVFFASKILVSSMLKLN